MSAKLADRPVPLIGIEATSPQYSASWAITKLSKSTAGPVIAPDSLPIMLSSLSSSLNNARTTVAQVLNFALVCVPLVPGAAASIWTFQRLSCQVKTNLAFLDEQVLSTAFMLWKGLSVASASSSPIVVVLSGSMEPAFQRGDLLFLWNRSPRTEVGEIVVYNVR